MFTFFSGRTIHIELLHNMSDKSFVLALILFTNLFGIPECIFRDNARSFVAGCNIVKKYLTSVEFHDRFGTFEIKHFTILLYAQLMGSVWEQMIKTIKLNLYKAVGRKAVEFYDLLTLFSDMQNVINSRLLTYRCSSDMETDIIAPVNFISPYIKERLILRMDEDESSTFFNSSSNSENVSSLRIRDDMLDVSAPFYDEYLLRLGEQCKDLYQCEFENKMKVGDIELIKNPAKTRPYWRFGRVLSLNIGDDGNVRFVNQKKGDGSKLIHSIKHLYTLKLSFTHNGPTRNAEVDSSATSDIDDFDRRRSKSSCTKKKQKDPNDPYIWY